VQSYTRNSFDVAASPETLEHDSEFRTSVKMMGEVSQPLKKQAVARDRLDVPWPADQDLSFAAQAQRVRRDPSW
jgi:hypothetical protein